MSDSEVALYRVPPQAVEVEKHVIGALFLDPIAVDTVSNILKPGSFYLEKNEIVYRTILSLHAQKKIPDIIAVDHELRRTGMMETVGESYLMEISAEVGSSANVAQHAEILKDKATLRGIIQTATMILEGAYAGGEPKEVLKFAGEGLYRLEEAARGAAEGLVDMPTLVLRAAKHYDEVAAGKITRTRFGISAIDDVIQGFKKSSLNIVAARPGIGKSALILQGAVECGLPVPIFSMEMLAEEEIERMMAHKDPSLNSDGVATQVQVLAKKHLIHAILQQLAKYPIEICDEAVVTVPYVQSECRRMKRKYGEIGMAIVDYLQMMEAVGNHSRNDLAIGSISKGLKKISNDIRAPVVAAASLSRECEKRDNKRPIESDLRDAGQIESDAHCIIFLYKEAKYNLKAKKDDRIKDIIEASIPKNRGGVTGRALLRFNGAQSWFFPVSHDDDKYYKDFLRGKTVTASDVTEAGGGASASKASPKGRAKGGKPSADWGKQTSLNDSDK